jgi:hypothetical protein
MLPAIVVSTIRSAKLSRESEVLVRLSRWPAECPEDSGHRALGDPHAEHLQFSVKPGRTPQRIGRHHARDESAYLDGGRRPAAAPAVHPGQTDPELPEARPLPPDDRVGLNVEQRAERGARGDLPLHVAGSTTGHGGGHAMSHAAKRLSRRWYSVIGTAHT